MLPVPSAVPAGPGPRPVYIHMCCWRLRPLHSFILISIYLLESRPTPAVPALHRPSRGKPPRLSRRFKQNHCHRRRHSSARATASRRRRGRMQSSHAPIERGRERASIGAKCVAVVRPASRCPSRLCLHEIKSLIQGNDRARQRRRKEGDSGDSGEPRGER